MGQMKVNKRQRYKKGKRLLLSLVRRGCAIPGARKISLLLLNECHVVLIRNLRKFVNSFCRLEGKRVCLQCLQDTHAKKSHRLQSVQPLRDIDHRLILCRSKVSRKHSLLPTCALSSDNVSGPVIANHSAIGYCYIIIVIFF